MARKGYRLYECFECHEEFWSHWIERCRSSRLKCPACGSLAVDPISRRGKDDIARTRDLGKAAATYEGFSGPGKRKLT